MQSSFLSFAPISEEGDEEEEGFFSKLFWKKGDSSPSNSSGSSTSKRVLPPISQAMPPTEKGASTSLPIPKKGSPPSQNNMTWMPGKMLLGRRSLCCNVAFRFLNFFFFYPGNRRTGQPVSFMQCSVHCCSSSSSLSVVRSDFLQFLCG